VLRLLPGLLMLGSCRLAATVVALQVRYCESCKPMLVLMLPALLQLSCAACAHTFCMPHLLWLAAMQPWTPFSERVFFPSAAAAGRLG
jgi:hypothetical protein